MATRRWPTLSGDPLDVIVRKAAGLAQVKTRKASIAPPPPPTRDDSDSADSHVPSLLELPFELTELFFSFLGSSDLLSCSQASDAVLREAMCAGWGAFVVVTPGRSRKDVVAKAHHLLDHTMQNVLHVYRIKVYVFVQILSQTG